MSVTLGDLLVYIKGDNRGLDKAIDESERKTKSFAQRTSSFIADSMKFAVGGFIKDSLYAVGNAFGKFVSSGIEGSANWQESLAMTRKLAELSGEPLDQLASKMERVRKLTTDLGKDALLPGATSADAAEVINDLVKGNLRLDDAMKTARPTMQLATLAKIEYGRSAESVTGILNAFGLQGEKSAKVIDMLAASEAKNAKSMEQTLAMIGQSGFAFAMMDKSIDGFRSNLTAGLTLMNAGLSGSDAGTAVKNAVIRMMAPTKEARKLMREFGISFYDANGQMKDFGQIAKDLNSKLAVGSQIWVTVGGATKAQNKAIEKASESAEKYAAIVNDETKSNKARANAANKVAEANKKIEATQKEIIPLSRKQIVVTEQMRNQALETIFLSDGMKAMTPIIAAQSKEWDEMYKSLDRNGAANDLLSSKQKTLKFQWEALKSSLETGAEILMRPFVGTDERMGFLTSAIERINDALGKVDWEWYSKKIDAVIKQLFSPYEDGGIIGALEELGVDQGALDWIEQAAKDATSAWNSASGTISAIVSDLSKAGDRASELWSIFQKEGQGGGLVGVLDELGAKDETLKNVSYWIGDIDRFLNNLKATAPGVAAALIPLFDSLKSAETITIEDVVNRFTDAMRGTANAANELAPQIASAWSSLESTAGPVWNQFWSAAKSAFDVWMHNMQLGLSGFNLLVDGKFYEAGNLWGSTLRKSWDGFRSDVDQLKKDLASKFDSIVSGIVNALTTPNWNGTGKNIVSAIAKGIVDAQIEIGDAIRSVVSAALEAARKKLNEFWSGFTDGFNSPSPSGTSSTAPGSTAPPSTGGGRPINSPVKPPSTPSPTPSPRKPPGGRETGSLSSFTSDSYDKALTVQVFIDTFNNNRTEDVDELAGEVARRIRLAV